MNEHSFKYFLAILSLISANRKLEPLSSISDITFLIGAQRSSHLVASLPRAPPHQKHVHLFTTTTITTKQQYHYYRGISTSQPSTISERKEVESVEGGGVGQQISRRKRGGSQIRERKRKGLDLDQLTPSNPPCTQIDPKFGAAAQISFSPP